MFWGARLAKISAATFLTDIRSVQTFSCTALGCLLLDLVCFAVALAQGPNQCHTWAKEGLSFDALGLRKRYSHLPLRVGCTPPFAHLNPSFPVELNPLLLT